MKPIRSPRAIPGSITGYTGPFHYVEYQLGDRMRIVSTPGSHARQLVITAHGCYGRWSGDVAVPPSTVVKFLNPHGTVLRDPGLMLATGIGKILFSSIASTYALRYDRGGREVIEQEDFRPLSGSSRLGWVKNYSLTKYEDDDVARLAHVASMNRLHYKAGVVSECDFLAIRNRKYLSARLTDVCLGDVFRELAAHGMHYDTIVCVFCRAPNYKDHQRYDALAHAIVGPA